MTSVSTQHPIISVTGSSGAGTSTVKHTFDQIFRREGITAASIEGDAFHRYDRVEMRDAIADATSEGNDHFSHFGPEANLLHELEGVFHTYAANGRGPHPPLRPRRGRGRTLWHPNGNVHRLGIHRGG